MLNGDLPVKGQPGRAGPCPPSSRPFPLAARDTFGSEIKHLCHHGIFILLTAAVGNDLWRSCACLRIQHLLSWPGPGLAGAVKWALEGSGVLEG